MRSTTRTAAGTIAVALALGAASPVAAAASQADRVKPGHVKVLKGDKGDKGDKASQGLRQVLREIAGTDARLVKATKESRTLRIGEYAAAVAVNVSADRAALAALAESLEAEDGSTDLRAVRGELKELRPQNYTKAINDLRHALRLAAEISEARTAVEGDVEAPVSELDAAQAALEAAVTGALQVTATSGKDALRAVRTDLSAAHEALEVVLDYLDNTVPEDDTVDDSDEVTEEEPVVEEPVVEQPVEEQSAA